VSAESPEAEGLAVADPEELLEEAAAAEHQEEGGDEEGQGGEGEEEDEEAAEARRAAAEAKRAEEEAERRAAALRKPHYPEAFPRKHKVGAAGGCSVGQRHQGLSPGVLEGNAEDQGQLNRTVDVGAGMGLVGPWQLDNTRNVDFSTCCCCAHQLTRPRCTNPWPR
jgi:hypothetical protein